MTRLLASVRLDVTIQWRNRFYMIGVGLSLLLALGISQFFPADALGTVLPLLFLFAVGGTALLYVAGLVIFEKDERTLEAVIVTPLSVPEYMVAKIVSLALLALVESVVVVLLTAGLDGYQPLPLLLGVLLLGPMLTLVGFVLIVRYSSITDFLIPVLVVALVLQLPFLYFLEISTSPLWLLIPTAAPTMLMWGAWHPLDMWQIIYGVGYSLVVIAALYRWAAAAFYRHIIVR